MQKQLFESKPEVVSEPVKSVFVEMQQLLEKKEGLRKTRKRKVRYE